MSREALLEADRCALIRSIGNTPMVRLNRMTHHLPDHIHIYAKLERFNPGGSVKDHAAWRMIRRVCLDDELLYQ